MRHNCIRRQVCTNASKVFKGEALSEDVAQLEARLAKTEISAAKVTVIRDLFQDFGTAIPQHRAAVLDALVELDLHHLQNLKNSGYRILAPRTLAELDSKLAKQPVPYEPTLTNEHASGISTIR